MDPFVAVVLKGVVPSIAAALLLVGTLGRRWTALAFGLGTFVAYVLLKDGSLWDGGPGPLLRPADFDGTQWLSWSIVLAAVLATLQELRLLPARVAAAAALLLLLATAYCMLLRLRPQWTTGASVLQIAASTGLLVLCWAGMRSLAARRQDLLLPVLWTCCLSADAVLLTFGNNSALLGQLAGAGAAALGAATGTALWRRPFVLGTPPVLPLALAHGGLLLAGHHFANPSPVAALAALLAPLGPWLAELPGAGQPRWRLLAGLASTAVLLGVAVGITLANASFDSY
ncbi:MAG TPA: hypothetical protein VK348_06370 [Planctomycetota bacterium]|nr:hypothetical protein [Planctomycetota bacterium]